MGKREKSAGVIEVLLVSSRADSDMSALREALTIMRTSELNEFVPFVLLNKSKRLYVEGE